MFTEWGWWQSWSCRIHRSSSPESKSQHHLNSVWVYSSCFSTHIFYIVFYNHPEEVRQWPFFFKLHTFHSTGIFLSPYIIFINTSPVIIHSGHYSSLHVFSLYWSLIAPMWSWSHAISFFIPDIDDDMFWLLTMRAAHWNRYLYFTVLLTKK